jgi:monolysocardiolipin acyltransferase
MTQAIRLLSDQPYYMAMEGSGGGQTVIGNSASHADHDLPGAGPLIYTSTSSTRHPPQPNHFPSPSVYSSNRHSWLHVFPEGMVHQSPATTLRYFKWGISRLLLESEPRAPEIVPIFIDGTQHIMPEARKWPRFAPRWGKKVTVAFGEGRDGEEVVGDLRARWRDLVRRVRGSPSAKRASRLVLLGEVPEEQLRVGEEAQAIRTETALRMRNQVLALRRSLGFADEDPAARLGFAETWKEDRKTTVGGQTGRKYKSRVDDSLINQD